MAWPAKPADENRRAHQQSYCASSRAVEPAKHGPTLMADIADCQKRRPAGYCRPSETANVLMFLIFFI